MICNTVQGFLTAVRQEVNRRHAADKWALDDVVLTSEVMHPAKDVDGIAGPPNEGVFVYGLYLDGCAWSNKENKLVDSEPKKLYSALPVLHVTGIQVSHAAQRPDAHHTAQDQDRTRTRIPNFFF